jgi:hypothetical protein
MRYRDNLNCALIYGAAVKSNPVTFAEGMVICVGAAKL